MGSSGFHCVSRVKFEEGEVILEVGSTREEGSTGYLARFAPVITIDPDEGAYNRAADIPNVTAVNDLAENVLARWTGTPIRFAWLDGHDFPYSHHPDSDWEGQRQQYIARGQAYSQEASRESHLIISRYLMQYVPIGGIIAFDDTWLDNDFDGKGGTAIPVLLANGFDLEEVGDIYHGLAVLRKKV
jgi:hypothetical protein